MSACASVSAGSPSPSFTGESRCSLGHSWAGKEGTGTVTSPFVDGQLGALAPHRVGGGGEGGFWGQPGWACGAKCDHANLPVSCTG